MEETELDSNLQVRDYILQDLKNIVGNDYATDADTTRFSYTLTQSPNLFFYPNKAPDYVVYPQKTEQVAAVMRLANRTRTPVLIRGSGSSSMSGNVSLEGGILIDLRHMDNILEINEDNMVAIAEGGCPFNKILRECYERGLLLPLAPEWQAALQVGANVATNATGYYINRTGRLGDMVVGLEVVLPTGEVVTLGSGAYKWGYHYHRYTGSPDLIGLFVNSGGTMGIITKVAIRLLNWPKMTYLTYGWPVMKINEVAKAHYELQRYAEIFNIQLLNRNTALALENIDFTPRIKIPDDVFFMMWINQAGQTEGELEARTKQAKEICENNGGIDLGDIWEKIGGPPRYWWFTMMCDTIYGSGLKPTKPGAVGLNSSCTMFYCPTLMFPKIYELGHKIYVEKYGFPKENYLWYGWADRNAMDPYPMFFFDTTDEKDIAKFSEFWREFHLEIAKRGCVSYNVGIGHPKEFLEWLGPTYDLNKSIKRLLDPNDIMNPGVL
jgi:glycolate oxidase